MAKSATKPAAKASKKAAPPPARAASPAASTSSRSDAGASSSSSDSDSDSSASDRSTVSPEPQPVPKARRVDPSTQKYTPPAGFKLFDNAGEKSGIDWDELNADKDLQLWAVRVPAGLKSKHLDKMVIQLPPAAIETPLQPVATFTASKSDYNAYLSTPSTSAGDKRKAQDAEIDAEGDAEKSEMDNMLALLPKKSAGNKLFQAPRPIAKTLTIRRALPAALANLPSAASFSHSTLIASQPSPVPGAILSAPELLDPVAIAHKKTTRSQPAGLKFRLELGGMKAVGGQGKYDNGVVLGPREVVQRVEVDEEERDAGEDEAMNDVENGAGETEEDKKRRKEEKKAKKDKKRKEKEGGGDEKSPKKKKVKTEA